MDEPWIAAKIMDVEIALYLGDITRIQADAIANAANSSLLGGGGVDGAIHDAAGPILEKDCRELHRQGGCPTGEARITRGGNLPASYVIHTVGPVWRGGDCGEPGLLAACYRNSIELARLRGLSSLVFPSISTGVFRYPVEKAAKTAREAVEEALKTPGSLRRVGWCLFGSRAFQVYRDVWS